jgi:AcrR family transcriptional regulator
LRAPNRTVQPDAASWRVTSKPMPLLAPVTSAIIFDESCIRFFRVFLLSSFYEESFSFGIRIMNTAPRHAYKPRKMPIQRRSTVTVEAIAEATIQVLLTVGSDRLTTTRVAERAGVSVGTLYQYYPNKQALLFAVLEVHMSKVAAVVEAACCAQRGAPIKILVTKVAEAFVDAKLERADVSTALYSAGSRPEGIELVRRTSKRLHRVLATALAEAAGKTADEIEFVSLMLYSAMAGATRTVLEAGAPARMVVQLREELPLLCQAYVAKSLRLK